MTLTLCEFVSTAGLLMLDRRLVSRGGGLSLSWPPICELIADGLFELGESVALKRDNGIKAIIKHSL